MDVKARDGDDSGEFELLADTAARRQPPSTPSTPFSLTVDPGPTSARTARLALHAWLVGAGCPDHIVDDVDLVASELVTNAVTHAASPARVFAAFGDDCLRLEVHDTSTTPPVRREEHGDFGGYGLQFVATIADDWGWSPRPTGKYVWTEHRVGHPPDPTVDAT